VKARSRLVALLVVALLLLAALLGEGWYLWLRGAPSPTADRPVVVSEVTRAAAVDAAASATAEILSTSWKDYDAQATQAEKLMKKSFAKEYARTSDQIRDEFVGTKTVVDMTVAWAGVHRAAPDRVQVLLFVDQVVSRDGGTPRTVPFRALVTVVPSGNGWLVSDLQTR
jgi:Mce-associated membrane protein